MAGLASCATVDQNSDREVQRPSARSQESGVAGVDQSAGSNEPSIPSAEEVEQRAFSDAVASGDGNKIRDLCLSGTNGPACHYIKSWCDRGQGVYCLIMAQVAQKRALTDEDRETQYRAYIERACHFKEKDGCAIQRQLAEDDRRRHAIQLVHDKVTCAMNPGAVTVALGAPDTNSSCTDHIHEAFRYGRRWVFFKSEGAFLIMDHENYHGPCLENPLMYPGGYRGWFICKDR